jgi:RNA polymerase sigma-70 factor (ECF subfamily)
MNIDPCEIRLLVRIATQRTGRPLHDEDLEQDATLKAVEALRKQFEVRYPRAFLRKIVCDTVRDHWRRRRQPEDLSAIDERHFAEEPCFEERLDQQRQVALLRNGLAQLDPAKRATLDLFYLEEWPVSEIARLQRKSISAVKMELLRARRLLARILSNPGGGKAGANAVQRNNATPGFRGIIRGHENRASTAVDGTIGRAGTENPSGNVREVCDGRSDKGR